MIGPDQVVNGVWMATVLILLGIIPNFYRSLRENLFTVRQLAFRFPVRLPYRAVPDPLPQPRWLALAGAAILLLTVAAYAI